MILETAHVPAMVHSLNFANATVIAYYDDGFVVVGEIKMVTLMNVDLVEITWNSHVDYVYEQKSNELQLEEWTMSVVGNVVFFQHTPKNKSPEDVLFGKVAHLFNPGMVAKVNSFTFVLDK